jgi:flotillin
MTPAILAGVLLFTVFLVAMLYKQNLKICQPSEVLIFSGRSTRKSDGRVLGYRVIKGGSAFRWPLIEAVDRLDLTNIPIELLVKGAYSKGGIPLNVQGVANVKIAGDDPTLFNAIERFLGRPQEQIQRIAKETLEGNLRGVLAALTPEQVNEDKIRFAESLLHEAELDLSKLGLVLDNLKIQNVTDDAGYLSSLGRKKSADLQKQSLIVEARAQAEAQIRAAKNEEETSVKQIDAQMRIAQAEAQRQVIDAKTKKDALVAEEQGTVAQLLAKARAEQDVQTARVEQIRRQLVAEVLEPAKASMAANEAKAKGEAAKIIENGRAVAQTFRQLAQTWKRSGPGAKDIMVLQKLEGLTGALLSTLGELKVDRLTVINGGAGGTGSLGQKGLALNEELKATLGVDLAGALRRLSGTPEALPPKLPKK